MKLHTEKLKVGIDIHGVIDRYPNEFAEFCEQAIDHGHEIHIVTGRESEIVAPKLSRFCIPYTHLFSIVDYHRENGTKMWNDDARGAGWWMEREDWVKSKGLYCKLVHLDLHFDNELPYAEHFPDYCTFVVVPPNGFNKILPFFQI